MTEPTTRQALAVQGRSKRLAVTGKLRTAIHEMVWSSARRADAAKAAGIQDHSLRAALKKPHVKAFYLSELEVLRTSERARNISALVDVRDSSGNAMARVAAAKALEGIAEGAEARPPGAPMSPGVVIVIGPPPAMGRASAVPMIDVKEVEE